MRFAGKLGFLLVLGLVALLPRHAHAQVSWYGITNRGPCPTGTVASYSYYPGSPTPAWYPYQAGYYRFSYSGGATFYVPPYAPATYAGRAYAQPGFSSSGGSFYTPGTFAAPLYARPPY
jgi:hypothetical protein